MANYKVGDKVRIKKREGNANDYPLYFSDEMVVKFEDKILTIKKVYPQDPSDSAFKRKYANGDYCLYKLLEPIADIYNWHSSMFELVTEEYKDGDKLVSSKTINNNENHEIRFQKPKASFIGGTVPGGHSICGRTNKTSIVCRQISYRAISC